MAEAGVAAGNKPGLSSCIFLAGDSLLGAMLVSEHLCPEHVAMDVEPATREEILGQLLEPLVASGMVKTPTAVVDELRSREDLMTTAVGGGFAVPHAYTTQVSGSWVVIGLCPRGTDFDAIDGLPVYCFFLLLDPESAYMTHLNLLARLSRILHQDGLLAGLLVAKTPEEAVDCIRASEAALRHSTSLATPMRG